MDRDTIRDTPNLRILLPMLVDETVTFTTMSHQTKEIQFQLGKGSTAIKASAIMNLRNVAIGTTVTFEEMPRMAKYEHKLNPIRSTELN